MPQRSEIYPWIYRRDKNARSAAAPMVESDTSFCDVVGLWESAEVLSGGPVIPCTVFSPAPLPPRLRGAVEPPPRARVFSAGSGTALRTNQLSGKVGGVARCGLARWRLKQGRSHCGQQKHKHPSSSRARTPHKQHAANQHCL